MQSILKRFGAAGVALLVLNEIRGLVMVGLALGAVLDHGRRAEAASPVECVAPAACRGFPGSVTTGQPLSAERR